MAESLYVLSLTDAAATFVASLPTAERGEALAFNPIDARPYHASTSVLQAIDPADPTAPPVNIPVTGDAYGDSVALAWHPPSSAFVGVDSAGVYFAITPSGEVTRRGLLDHPSGGLAWVTP